MHLTEDTIGEEIPFVQGDVNLQCGGRANVLSPDVPTFHIQRQFLLDEGQPTLRQSEAENALCSPFKVDRRTHLGENLATILASAGTSLGSPSSCSYSCRCSARGGVHSARVPGRLDFGLGGK